MVFPGTFRMKRRKLFPFRTERIREIGQEIKVGGQQVFRRQRKKLRTSLKKPISIREARKLRGDITTLGFKKFQDLNQRGKGGKQMAGKIRVKGFLRKVPGRRAKVRVKGMLRRKPRR